jgi:hypothetical protein
VTVIGYDPDGEKRSLKIVSAAMGYVTQYAIPEMGNILILIVNQGTPLPQLEHDLLITMQMRLYDVVVNESPKFQCLEPTDLSHTISVSGDGVDDVLIIPLDLSGGVSCFPIFKPTQEKFKALNMIPLRNNLAIKSCDDVFKGGS